MIKLIQIMNAYFTEVQKLGTFPEMQYPNTSLYHITSCDGGWTPFPAHRYPEHPNVGRCYHHHMSSTWTWTEARAYCHAFQKADSDLASIQDWRTNDFVTRLAPDGTMFWIGANRGSGSWQWTDHRQWHYTNWAPGHPTIGTVYVAIGENGVWRDYNDNGPMSQGVPGIMCQYTGGEVTRGT